ncbi:DUF1929 domain-containing protein [Polaromonas sp.]|nr:DUF1929 domain-containing protein [Candidatus Saccharibacteria bacterium]
MFVRISQNLLRTLQLSVIILALTWQLGMPAAYALNASVQNAGLEQTTNNTPDCFSQSGYGANIANWSLTAAAHTGTVAQQLVVSNYTGGDRKLIITENATCAPTVTAGSSYQLGAWYTSTAPKISLTVFKHSAAGWAYWTDIATAPASAGWAQISGTTPLVPNGTDQLSFGVSLADNGTLVTDDYSLAPAPTVVPTAGNELTYNQGLETGTPPSGWFVAGWGDSVVTKSVVTGAAAHSGAQAYAITISGRTQGDYKLIPVDSLAPAVQPGSSYQLSAWYKSTSSANSLTVFAHTAAGWEYYTDLQTLPPVDQWTQAIATTKAIPAGVDAIAWGISIAANGTLVTDDYSTTRVGTITPPANSGPGVTGRWTVLTYAMPVRAAHATLLKNGKVLLIAGSGNSVDNFTANSFKASVWDPIAGTFNTLNVPKDMFCSGHVVLPDGRVLIQGGTKAYPTTAGGGDYAGLRDSWIFNPDTNEFITTNLANEGHWYPTLIAHGNGDITALGGLKEDTKGAVNTERFNTATSQWLPTNQIPQSYSFWGLYPHMFLMQDGRMFYSGAHVFGNGLPGSGSAIFNPDTGSIGAIAGLRMKDMRDQASSFLLPPAQDQKVLITGGGNSNTLNPAINLTDIIDLKAATPTYKPGPDLPGMGKMYLNAATLPDRTVLTMNGAQLNRNESTNVLSAASYDPATNMWTTLPADPVGRNYHSSSLLLPDGRVAVFGSNPGSGYFELKISVYEPSYLFRSARPVISNVPAAITYGQNIAFNVNANGKTIKWAQLIRPGSVTHQMDSNMRLVDLPIVVQNGVATVSLPSNRNLLPPGPYMITLTDSDNVPSSALTIMVK